MLSKQVDDLNDIRTQLLTDLLLFTRVMFEKRTGREFLLSQPTGRESHFKTICRELTDVFTLKTKRLLLNCPPGWSKSELCKSFIAWSLAHYPDSKFLYISHSFDLAAMHTHSIKQTLQLPIYKHLFDIDITRDTSAKDYFKTGQGGAVAAFGSQGGITGHDAGLPGLERFSGAIIIDDIHKPEDVHSDTIREKVQRNYFETIERRLRSPNVPIVLLGQRLHEDDLPAHLLSGSDGQEWRRVIIKGIDEAGNAGYPEVNPLSQLLTMQEKQPYVFASQYQQDPLPAGGGLYKEDWFPVLDVEPTILSTFLTVDAAETEEAYNDATAFSFWGLYQVKFKDIPIDNLYAVHWLDCAEIRVEPKDLEDEFLDFYADCMQHRIKPEFVAIEKKSSGVTLLSMLKNVQGLRTIDVNRTKASGSKTVRFLEMQKYIANKQVSLPANGKHTRMCLDHMRKITANNTHRWDDICDTVYDSIKIALIDKTLLARQVNVTDYRSIAKNLANAYERRDRKKKAAYGRSTKTSRST